MIYTIISQNLNAIFSQTFITASQQKTEKVCNVRQPMNEIFENFEQVMLNLAGTSNQSGRRKR